MCVTSMIGDHYRDQWTVKDWFQPYAQPVTGGFTVPAVQITRAEFDDLRKQVGEMVVLLKRAKAYDERNNEPACETDEKMDLLRRVAKMVGVDLDAALAPKAANS